MYNRYIRNDRGTYTRVPEDDVPPSGASAATASPPPTGSAAAPHAAEEDNRSTQDAISGALRRFLDRFHLDHVDTGDLLLLLLLFLLFEEDADEELLYALGLLLVL